MSKKAYVVTNGDYSGYRIIGVFTSKALAKKAVGLFDRDDSYNSAGIEEWLLDGRPQMRRYYTVEILRSDGSEIYRWDYAHFVADHLDEDESVRCANARSKDVVFGMSTRGYDQALKIARDHRTKLDAKKAGLTE